MAATTTCNPLNTFQFVLGWILLWSTVFLAYLPQWIKQCKMRTHIGMSLSNYLCATLVALLQLLNYLSCKYEDTFRCCTRAESTRTCLAAIQPVAQATMAFLGYVVVVALYFYFFDRQGLGARGHDAVQDLASAKRKVLAAAMAAHLMVVGLVVLLFVSGSDSNLVWMYGVGAEVIASVLLATHWCLQMWETWSLRSVGSLSLFGLMVGCVGNLVTAYSLGVHGGFVVSVSNLLAALMIGATLAMAHYVERADKDQRALIARSSNGSHDNSAMSLQEILREKQREEGLAAGSTGLRGEA